MKIAIGADHGGFKLKEILKKFLRKKGHQVKDFGTYSEESYDYPIVGILICKTGVGMSIVANKIRGVRAALCDRIDIARSSRMHNDANVLILAANIVSAAKAKRIVGIWLSTPALRGRHRRRVSQISEIEKLI